MKNWKIVLILGTYLSGGAISLAQPSNCETSSGTPTKLLDVSIEGGDFVVSVEWGPGIPVGDLASLEVVDKQGDVVAARAIVTQGRGVEAYPVLGGPTFFEDFGYWFDVRMVDSGGRLLAPQLPMLVSFCPSGSGCTYSVVKRVGTGAVAMGGELFSLLDELESMGSQDLLGDALQARPDLDYQVFWVADQMAKTLGPRGKPRCTCLWNTEFDLTPAFPQVSVDIGNTPENMDYPDWESFSVLGAGANFFTAGQILAGPERTFQASAMSRGGLHVRCRSASSWRPVTWSGVSIAFPTLKPCAYFCGDATIQIEATAETHVAANAVASGLDGARSHQSATVSLFLEGSSTPEFTAASAVAVERLPGDATDSLVADSSGPVTDDWLLAVDGTTVSFFAEGQSTLCLQEFGAGKDCSRDFRRPLDDTGPWAYGCASARSIATLLGVASCALNSPQILWLVGPAMSEADGLVIVPWKP